MFFLNSNGKRRAYFAPRGASALSAVSGRIVFLVFSGARLKMSLFHLKKCARSREREREVALYEREASESARRTNSENKGKEPKRNGKQTDNKKWARVRRRPGPCRQAQGTSTCPRQTCGDRRTRRCACPCRRRGLCTDKCRVFVAPKRHWPPTRACAHARHNLYKKKKEPTMFSFRKKTILDNYTESAERPSVCARPGGDASAR